MPKKTPDCKNYIKQLLSDPDEALSDADGDLLPFDEFLAMKFGGALLPPGILCMIREHKANGKIKEHVYQRRHAANRKIKQLWLAGHEYTLIDQDHCEHIDPIAIQYDDPLA